MAIKVLPGPLFSARTTLRLGGRAAAELRLETPGDALGLSHELSRQACAPFMLGHGSNLLAADHDLDLAVVSLEPGQPRTVDAPHCCDGREGGVSVLAPGGFMLPRLINWACSRGLSGLESLAGIPGTVGGAVAMNAGSYGAQTADVLERVFIWDQAGGARWIGPAQWRAGYRTFVPTDVPAGAPWLALEAQFGLACAAPEAVRGRADGVLARKKASQPVGAATCGCAFKNPEGHSAGRLLDALGFRGRSVGGMCFSPMHANFLVNEGGGTARAALELIDMARAAVRAAHGLELELEVRVLS